MNDAAEQSRACDIPGVAHTAHPALLVTPPLRLVHIPSKRVWTSMREGPGSSGLAEAVTLIKGLLNGEQVALAGRHYRVTGRTNYPLPVQRPPPPIPHRRQGPEPPLPRCARNRHRGLLRDHLSAEMARYRTF